MPLLDERNPYGQNTMTGVPAAPPPPSQLSLADALRALAALPDHGQGLLPSQPPQLSIGPAPIPFTPPAQSPTFQIPAYTPPQVQTQVVDRVAYNQQQQQQEQEARQMADALRQQQRLEAYQQAQAAAQAQANRFTGGGFNALQGAVTMTNQIASGQRHVNEQGGPVDVRQFGYDSQDPSTWADAQAKAIAVAKQTGGTVVFPGQDQTIGQGAAQFAGQAIQGAQNFVNETGLNQHIPGSQYVADAAGQVGKFAGQQAANTVLGPALALGQNVLPDNLQPQNVLGATTGFVAENLVPTEVWQAALELVPGIGTVPDLLKAVKAGAPEAISALLRAGEKFGAREDVQKLVTKLAEEQGASKIPGKAGDEIIPGLRSTFQPSGVHESEAMFTLPNHVVVATTRPGQIEISMSRFGADTGVGLGRMPGGNISDLREVGRLVDDIRRLNPTKAITAVTEDARLAGAYQRLGFVPAESLGKDVLKLDPEKFAQISKRFNLGKAAESVAPEVVKPIEVPPEVKSVLAKRGVRVKPGSWEALPPVNRDFIADMAKTSVSNFDRKALLAEGRRKQVLGINEAYARTDLTFAERQALASKNMEGAILPEFQGVGGNYTPEKLAALKGQIDVAKDKGLISSFQWKTAGDVFDRLMTGGKQLEPAQKKLMGTIFGPEFEAAIPEGKNWDLWREATGVLGIPQALTSTLDISAVGRQMAPLGWTHPQAYLEALGTIKTAIRSDAGAAQVMHGLMAEPWMTNAPFPEAEGLSFVDLGGRLADIGGHLTESEGQFAALNQSRATRLVEKLPWVKPSERVYNVPINVLRGKVYQQYATNMWKAGERNPQAYKDVLDVIDHATGWSDFKMGQIASGINAFYSPRNTAARFQVLFDPFIKSGSLLQPSARQLAARNLVGFVSANITLLGAMSASGILAGKALGIPNPVSVELDPRSTDMWKGRIGNMRVDMTGGFGSIIRLVARLAPLATGNPAQVKNAAGRIENADAGYLVDQFIRGKMGPVPGMIWDALGIPGGEAYAADFKSKSGLRTAAFNNLTPFFVQDVVEAWREQSPTAAAIAAPVSFFGGSVNTYPPSESAAKKEAKASGADVATQIGGVITAQKKIQPASLEQDWNDPARGWQPAIQQEFPELGDVSQYKDKSALKAAWVEYIYAKDGNDPDKNEAETRKAIQADFERIPLIKEWDKGVESDRMDFIRAHKDEVRKLHDAGQVELTKDELAALNRP